MDLDTILYEQPAEHIREHRTVGAFSLHQLAHSHNMQAHRMPIGPAGLSPAVRRS